jgi:hypothetical protein
MIKRSAEAWVPNAHAADVTSSAPPFGSCHRHAGRKNVPGDHDVAQEE